MDELAAATFYPPEKIVRPHTRTYRRLPVAAICGDQVLTEDGTVGTFSTLLTELRELPPTLFVAQGSADILGDLDNHFHKLVPGVWQWRVTNGERPIVAPNGIALTSRVSTVIQFFGFRNGNYHKMIDPITIYAKSIDKVWPGDRPEIVRLLEWAIALRDFCDDNEMEVRPTMGAVSTQFLTDQRFYPNARRKVPRATNDSARDYQGNHYHLSVIPDRDKSYNAWYIDQRRAHHYHARLTDFPNADELYAMGDFITQDRVMIDGVTGKFYGLYCLDLTIPTKRISPYVRGWLRQQPGDTVLEKQYIFSNEIQYLQDLGYAVVGIRAAWGSDHLDTGLAKYSVWAEEQLDEHNDAPWLKPILLSTYGALASRPRIAEMIHKEAKKGEPVTIAVGRNKLTGILTQGKRKLEPRTANVLHRAMIDAAQRIESIAYADYLDTHGYRVLSINADAVMVQVDEDRPLPFIPEPWRLKGTLTRYQPVTPQGFISDQVTKLPGVNGEGREMLKYRQATPGHAPPLGKYGMFGDIVPVTKHIGR